MVAAIGIAVGVVGVGLAAFFWWHPRRARVTIELTEVAIIAPHLMGLDVGLRLGDRDLRNLYLLEVAVTSKGPTDAVDPNADDPKLTTKRPRIDFPQHFKIPQQPWLHSPFEPAGDVRITAYLRDIDGVKRQSVAVHIHHLRRGTTVRHRLLATCEVERPTAEFSLRHEDVEFFPGAVPNVTVRGQGLLSEPPPTLKV